MKKTILALFVVSMFLLPGLIGVNAFSISKTKEESENEKNTATSLADIDISISDSEAMVIQWSKIVIWNSGWLEGDCRAEGRSNGAVEGKWLGSGDAG